MDYSQKTQDLIDRMCRNVERKEFVLNKSKAEELILKTYDLFNLPRPKNIQWCVDLQDKDYLKSASLASSASSAWSARSTRSAWSARSASLASSAWSARSARSASSASLASSAWSAWSARSARSASSASSAWSARSTRSASSASSAWSARSALDYDFDYFVMCEEYNIANTDGNENDIIYLEYCELLMQAKEAGLGYRIEYEDTLYLVPTPIVRLNNDTPPQFHSDQLPAIEWKGGEKVYALDGVVIEYDVWQKIVSKTMTFSEIMAIEISDIRTIALKYNPQAIIKENAQLIHADERGNELYLVRGQQINTITKHPKMWFVKMTCPTSRTFIEGVDPEFAESNQNATDCQAWLCGLTKSEYQSMVLES